MKNGMQVLRIDFTDEAITLGFDGGVFSCFTPGQMESVPWISLEGIRDTGGVCTPDSSDATPKTATWENLLAVTEVVEKQGRFPLRV